MSLSRLRNDCKQISRSVQSAQERLIEMFPQGRRVRYLNKHGCARWGGCTGRIRFRRALETTTQIPRVRGFEIEVFDYGKRWIQPEDIDLLGQIRELKE